MATATVKAMKKYPGNTFYQIYLDGRYTEKLFGILNKFTYNFPQKKIDKIIAMIKIDAPDQDKNITNYFDKLITNYDNNNKNIMNNTKRVNRISNIIYDFYKLSKIRRNIGSYLDIGSNTGAITKKLSELLHVSNIPCAIDIKSFNHKEIIPVEGINFSYYDGINIPYEDNYFDLVSCFMVLHHVEYLDQLVIEINRVIKKNGFLLLKEHASPNIYMDYVIYIEHMLYSIKSENVGYDDFVSDYYQKTYSINGMVEYLEKFGFEPQFISNKKFDSKHHANNPDNTYYSIYKKI
jgi:ubiquinone/menaquinone biosynthesis C-methylase UbiE